MLKSKGRQALALAAFQSQPPVFVWRISDCDAAGRDGQPQSLTANRLAAVFSLSQLDMGSGGFSEAVIVSSEHTNGDHGLRTSHELE